MPAITCRCGYSREWRHRRRRHFGSGTDGRLTSIAIAEADDATLIAKWALEWNDLFEFQIRPVMTDEQAGPLLAQMLKQ